MPQASYNWPPPLSLHKILAPAEVDRVTRDLHRRRSSKSKRKDLRWPVKLAVFILSTFYGLRAKEIGGLNLRDLHRVSDKPKDDRPFIFVRAENTKGRDGMRKPRHVPLTWPPRWVYEDLRLLIALRVEMGALPDDPLVCSLEPRAVGKRLNRKQVGNYFKTACWMLDRPVHVHMGRHTFATMALGEWRRDLVEVQHAMGHRDIRITSMYLHLLDRPERDWAGVGEERKVG